MLVLDYNEDRSLTMPAKNGETFDSLNITTMSFDPSGDFQHQKAKIKIDTLSNYAGFGGGNYKMTSVKRMTTTSAFLNILQEPRQPQKV